MSQYGLVLALHEEGMPTTMIYERFMEAFHLLIISYFPWAERSVRLAGAPAVKSPKIQEGDL
jgi:hypothetical protein